MAKSIIVYGPDMDLMQQHAEKIFDHYGIEKRFGFDWTPVDGCVVLLLWTHKEFPQQRGVPDVPVVAFRDFAKVYNDNIPLTDWQSGPPPMVGDWNASANEDTEERRWWDGYDWSCLYYKYESQESQNDSAGYVGAFTVDDILWRGLSSEPIKVTE